METKTERDARRSAEFAARKPQRDRFYAMDHAAIKGETVTQGHANYCAEYGHAVTITEGQYQGTCPRCGEVTSAPAADATGGPTMGFDQIMGYALAALAAADTYAGSPRVSPYRDAAIAVRDAQAAATRAKLYPRPTATA